MNMKFITLILKAMFSTFLNIRNEPKFFFLCFWKVITYNSIMIIISAAFDSNLETIIFLCLFCLERYIIQHNYNLRKSIILSYFEGSQSFSVDFCLTFVLRILILFTRFWWSNYQKFTKSLGFIFKSTKALGMGTSW